jgi:hypothetical protein
MGRMGMGDPFHARINKLQGCDQKSDPLRKAKSAHFPAVERGKKYTQRIQFTPKDATTVDFTSFMKDQEFNKEIKRNIANAVPWTESAKIMAELLDAN